MSFNTLPQNLP